MSSQLYNEDLKLDGQSFEFRLLRLHSSQWCEPLVGDIFKTRPS